MPQTIKPMGLIHKPGSGPNSRFDFINKANNKGNETKEAPPGTYFTKSGNLVKGRLTKAAKDKGARETDPKDKQRSKVPPVTQSNEARGTCWHGYQQKGYKKKGNKMVPNCVKEEAISENKIKLSKDPNYFGAVGLEKYKPTGPVVNIPVKQLVGFEPDDKMRDPKSMAKVNAIAKAVQDKKTIPPILARKYKNGYQVIDGHHRFWGQRKAGVNAIKAQIIPPEDIEEAAGVGIVTKQNATKDVPVGGEYMNIKKLGLGKGKPKTMREEFAEFLENFADGKRKGKSRPGRVKRSGASCKGSVSSLRSKAKKYGGERGKMYHWCANMKSGRKKSK